MAEILHKTTERDMLSRDKVGKDGDLRCLFLLSRSRHARMWRRVRRVREYIPDSVVFAFERDDPPALQGEFISLGRVEHGDYLGRLPKLLRTFLTLRREICEGAIVFAFSLDLLLIARFAAIFSGKRAKFVYEVADIYDLLAGPRFISRLLRFAEGWAVRRCTGFVVTSEAFIGGYLNRHYGVSPESCVVIEHKPELPIEERILPTGVVSPGHITIGYFGTVKDARYIQILTEAANRSSGRLRVQIAGLFKRSAKSESFRFIKNCSSCEFLGPYHSPDDLGKLYRSVDLIWDAYHGDTNASLQRTTRFSEALFFARPLICQFGTQDGALCEKLNIGKLIDVNRIDESIEALVDILEVDILRWGANCARVPETMFRYSDEYQRLARIIKKG